MSDEDKGTSGNDAELEAARERARRVEDENKALKAEDKKRRKSEDDKKAAAAAQDLDSAKSRMDELNKLTAKLESENEALRKREQARIDNIVKGLPDAAKKRLKAVKDDVSLAKFSELVELESSDTSKGDTKPMGDESKGPGTPPPPVSLGGVRRRSENSDKGRQLQPGTYDLLDEWGESPDLARQLMSVDQVGSGHRFVVPPGQLRRMLTKQAPTPILLNRDNAPRE